MLCEVRVLLSSWSSLFIILTSIWQFKDLITTKISNLEQKEKNKVILEPLHMRHLAKALKSSRNKVQSLYNIPHYNTDMNITRSCCGFQIFSPWNFTNELQENDHGPFPIIPLQNCPYIAQFAYNKGPYLRNRKIAL